MECSALDFLVVCPVKMSEPEGRARNANAQTMCEGANGTELDCRGHQGHVETGDRDGLRGVTEQKFVRGQFGARLQSRRVK